MQLSGLDQIIVVVYLAAIMSIGFAMKRKASKGMSSYFLGGRQLPWWALAISPFKLDFFNTIVALIGITALYVSMLYLILHRLEIAFSLLAMTLISTIVLYFSWYKTLPPPAPPMSEDAENFMEQTDEILQPETV